MPTLVISDEVHGRLFHIKNRDGHSSVDSVIRYLMSRRGPTYEIPRQPIRMVVSEKYGEFVFFNEEQLKHFQDCCSHPSSVWWSAVDTDNIFYKFTQCERCGKQLEKEEVENTSVG